MTRYTRDNPAPNPKRKPIPRRKPIQTPAGWHMPPLKQQRGTPPWEILPNRAWFAANPDVVEVSWVVPIVCTGRGAHKATRLGSAARVVYGGGLFDLVVNVPTKHEVDRWRDRSLPRSPAGGMTTALFHPPDPTRAPGEGSRTAGRFLCPRCPLDVRAPMGRLLRLAELDTPPVAELDVSKLA